MMAFVHQHQEPALWKQNFGYGVGFCANKRHRQFDWCLNAGYRQFDWSP